MRPDYSDSSEDYDRYRSFPQEIVDRYLSNFEELAKLRGGERILDGGAGTARFAVTLSQKYKVTALDASKEMIERGAAKSRKIRWVQGDLARTPFRPRRFDCTFLAYVIHQMPDFQAVIEEMARLSPRCVIVTTDMRSRLPTLLDAAFPGVIEVDRERFPPIEELEGAFILSGFEHVRARRILLEERISKLAYMDKIRHKYLSTFDLISQSEFDEGVKKMEKVLAQLPGEEFVNRVQATFVSASSL